MRATQRLYLTWDRERVVQESNPDGRFLFCKPGDEVPDELAKKYGLLEEKRAAVPPAPVQQMAATAAPKPGARKAKTPGEDLDAHSDEELLEIARTMEVEIQGSREDRIVAILKKAGYEKEAGEREKKAAAAAENKQGATPPNKGGVIFPPGSRRQ